MSANNSSVIVRLRLLGRQAFAAEARSSANSLSTLQRAGKGLNSTFKTLATGAGVLALAVGAGTAAIAMMGAKTNQTQDAQRVSFTALLKSKAKAASMMRQIQQLALDSPILDPATTGDAVRMLMAYGINAGKVIPLVKSLGDMSAASGKAIAEVMPRAALALGQIEGKGKLQAQEMNQLAESVGLSRKAIRKELHMTAKDFEDTFKPGKNIKSAVAIPAIMRAMTNQSAGAADMLAKTTAGRISRGKEVMALAAGDFTRPFYDEIGKLATKAGDTLSRLQASGGVKGFSRGLFSGQKTGAVRHGRDIDFSEKGRAQNTGAKIREQLDKIGRGALDAGKQFLDAFKPAQPFLKNVLLPLLKGLAVGVGGNVLFAFKGVLAVIKPVMSVLGWIGTKIGPNAKKTFEGVGKAVGFVFGGAILKVLGMMGKLGFVFRLMRGPIRLIEKMISGLGRIFKSQAMTGGMMRFGDLLKGVSEKFHWILSPILAIIAAAKKLGLLGGDDKKKPAAPVSHAFNGRKPRAPTARDRRNTQRVHKRQNDAVDDAFGDGFVAPLGGRNRLSNAPAPVIHNHLHARVQIDGRDTHRSTVKVERRNQDAKP